MTTLLALVLLREFRIVVFYLLISLTLAATVRPLFIRLVQPHFLVRMSWILLYLVAVGGFGFLLFITAKNATHEIQQLAHTVSVQDEWQLPIWLDDSSFQQSLIAWLPPPSVLFEAVIGDQGQLVLRAILGFTAGISGLVSGIFVVVFLSLYLCLD